uniref:Mei2-like C-terminal RNA recognition motif domain-containing protein n=1 Tax=Noctiluca scintillans TaxID=2966 RepID=A0A7S0ZVS2_NOCSC
MVRHVGSHRNFPPLDEAITQYRGPDLPVPEGTVTLMVQKVPRCYTADTILSEFGEHCDVSLCDMLRLPLVPTCESNIGFAFVNFATTEAAQSCFYAMSGRSWSMARTEKPCRIVAARIQGLRENLEHYILNQKHERLQPPFSPILVSGGRRVDLETVVNRLCDLSVRQVMEHKRHLAAVEDARLALMSFGELHKRGCRFKSSLPPCSNEERDPHYIGQESRRKSEAASESLRPPWPLRLLPYPWQGDVEVSLLSL